MNTRDIAVATLEFLNGPHKGQTVMLPPGRHIVGTHRHANIRLIDKTAAGFAGYLDVADAQATLTLRQPSAAAGTRQANIGCATHKTFTIGATRMRVTHSNALDSLNEDSVYNEVTRLWVSGMDAARPAYAQLKQQALEHAARLGASARALIDVCSRRANASLSEHASTLADRFHTAYRTVANQTVDRIKAPRHATRFIKAAFRTRQRPPSGSPPASAESALQLARNRFDALIARPAAQTAAAVAAVAVLLAVATLTTVDQVSATATEPLAPQSLATLIEGELEDHAFSNVLVAGATGDSVQLSGLVDTGAERQRIENLFDARPYSVDLRKLKTGSDIANTITEVFAQLGYPELSAEFGDAGKVTVEGYLSSPADWREIQALLQRDFPAIGSIDSSALAFLDTRLKALREMLDATQIGRAVQTRTSADDIFVTGMLSPAQTQQWQHIRRDFVDRYGNSPRLVDEVAVKAPLEPPSIEIAGSVVSATKSFCITAEGRIYKLGETMLDGSVVQRIGTKQVTVTNNGERFVLPVRVKG